VKAATPGALPNAKPVREGASLSRLLLEIERYLAAVDCFRRLGCEPHWRA